MGKTIAILLLIFTNTLFAQNTNADIISEIRTEFKLINDNKALTVKTISLPHETTAGVEITVYYNADGEIRKITEAQYGEMGRMLTDYYVKNNILIFSFAQRYEYNRPIYWDIEMAKKSGDTVFFDLSKSKIYENRYYFNSESQMVRWINESKVTLENHNELIKVEKEVNEKFNNLRDKID